MRFTNNKRRLTIYPAVLLFAAVVFAQPAPTNNVGQPIDLPTALRLAGAESIDVKIAQARLAQAKAEHQSALARFLPWIAPGISYHRRDGLAQAVPAGTISGADFYSYAPGAAVGMQLDLGDALYKSLAAKQVARAARHGLEAQRQDTIFAAAQDYFELLLAQSAAGVANEAVRISNQYETQLGSAVQAGIAYQGELLRARVQAERNRLTLRRAGEQRRVAAARLAEVLRLDPAVDLVPRESELVPLTLVETNSALASLVAQALASRPELKRSAALASAAGEVNNGATYGPLVPTLGAQGFWGGLGGGPDNGPETFGAQQDYAIGATWRIGPGGLFDFTRLRSTKAQLKIAELNFEKLKDGITRQVVEGLTHSESLSSQLETAKRALSAADEAFRLAQQRKGFEVGNVLETILAEQELTQARLDLVKTIAQYNQAQYSLLKAIGKISPP